MNEESALEAISEKFAIDLKNDRKSFEENFEKLARHIDFLIQSDFNKLMSILYRVDVYESKLKKALAETNDEQLSGHIIARLLLEREAEKIRYRQHYKE